MGRLRCAAGDGACPDDASGLQRRLAETLEEWRHRPDLCLMWVAFCEPSTLTLADGVRLAKTRRCATEVLQLLSGVGLTGGEAELAQQDRGGEPSAKAPSQDAEGLWRAALHVDGGKGVIAAVHNVEPLSLVHTESSPAAAGGDGPSGRPPTGGPQPALAPACKAWDADASHFRRCAGLAPAPWVAGDFTTVARLARSAHAEVRHVVARDGVHLAAKVAPLGGAEQEPEESERRAWFRGAEPVAREDLLTEAAVLLHLQRGGPPSPFLIRLVGIFQDASSAYLLTELCDGGELFERVAAGGPLAEAEQRRYVSQLLEALRHLHARNLGHRDVSLENVLLRRGDCVLMDFGQAVRLRAEDGTVLRYFAEAGKRLYRAPEMYVPRERPVQVVCPPGAAPGGVAQVSYDRCRCEVLLPADAVPSRPCMAEPHGYAAAPADLFACGVCAFIILVGKPPWSVACDADPSFSFIRRHGVPNLLHQWRGGGFQRPGTPPSDEEALLTQLLRVDPAQRPGAEEALRSPWLAEPARRRVQTY